MKKNNFLILIFVILLLIFELGLYQNKIITVKDVSFEKPFFYRMQLIKINNEEDISFDIKNYLALNSEFEIKESLLFIFKKFYTLETISLLLTYSPNENNKFQIIKNKYFENCLLNDDYRESKNKNLYGIDGLIKKSNIHFILKGNNKNDLIKLRDNLCKQ